MIEDVFRNPSLSPYSASVGDSVKPHRDGRVNPDKDERVALPLDPDDALRALLAVDPDDEEATDRPHGGTGGPSHGDPK